MSKKYSIILGIVFSAITVIMRLIPHPWNFTPIGALFLFSGFYLPKKWIWLPLASLAISDVIIGSYQWQVMMAVYGTYAITMFASRSIRGHDISNVLMMSIGSALLFFFITNFSHWMWFGGYSHDLSGLAQAYVAGIPFFRNSLLGYAFYSCVFFAIKEIISIKINAVNVIKGIVI